MYKYSNIILRHHIVLVIWTSRITNNILFYHVAADYQSKVHKHWSLC